MNLIHKLIVNRGIAALDKNIRSSKNGTTVARKFERVIPQEEDRQFDPRLL